MTVTYADAPRWLFGFERRLTSRLYRRNARRPCLFWFCAAARPALIVEPMNPKGEAAYDKWVQRASKSATGAVYSGGLRVDDGGRFVFVGPGLDEDFLAALAGYAKDNIGRVPALASLFNSLAADVSADTPLKSIKLSKLELVGNSAAFADLLSPSHRRTAAELAGLRVGERAWFWFSPLSRPGAPKLIVQNAAADPRMDLFNQQVDKASQGTLPSEPPTTGVINCIEGGGLQLVSTSWSPGALPWLAAWVRDTGALLAGLRRLKGCQLVVAPGDTVEAVIADDGLWAGVPDTVAPGTLSEAAQVLGGLSAGEQAWFWLTDRGVDQTPFLSLKPLDEDPYAHDFNEQVAIFGRRFPGGRTSQGMVTQLQSGTLVFSAQGDSNALPVLLRRLVQAEESLPALGRLRSAKLSKSAPAS